MPARAHVSTIGVRRAERQLIELGDEFREARLNAQLSQAEVSNACKVSRNHYRQLEAGHVRSATVLEINAVATVLGLEIGLRAFPGGLAIRDAGQSKRLAEVLQWVRPPLSSRLEVPLSPGADRWDRRAWDAMLFGHGDRTAIELEMRLRDVQAVRRRHELKRRDDPPDHFMLLIADTRHNRRVLAEVAGLFAELPRLRPSVVRAALGRGNHPGTGLLLV
jgi:transcriptional regulator with XRE-family HTH domain